MSVTSATASASFVARMPPRFPELTGNDKALAAWAAKQTAIPAVQITRIPEGARVIDISQGRLGATTKLHVLKDGTVYQSSQVVYPGAKPSYVLLGKNPLENQETVNKLVSFAMSAKGKSLAEAPKLAADAYEFPLPAARISLPKLIVSDGQLYVRHNTLGKPITWTALGSVAQALR